MESKKILVSLMTLTFALVFMTAVSASVSIDKVLVNDIELTTDGDGTTVYAGETVNVKIQLSGETDDVIEVIAELKGYGKNIEAETQTGPFFGDSPRMVSLDLTIPFDSKDLGDLYKDVKLVIEVENDVSTLKSYPIRIQRQAYNAEVMSISTGQNVNPGKLFPVDVVIKNRGSLDLDDLYVTASIPGLEVERTVYFGDLVSLELDDDNEDTVSGRIYLEIPEDAKSGIYDLVVEALNDDATTTQTKQIYVENQFSDTNVFATVTSRTVSAGQNAEYGLIVVNPTNKLKVFNIVPETSDELFVSASESIVVVPAGTSKTVKIVASARTDGTYNFNVNVLSGDAVFSQVTLGLNAEGQGVSNPVVVLTVVLAIIFIVLLIVLFVLVGKKPEKSEEFGESYY